MSVPNDQNRFTKGAVKNDREHEQPDIDDHLIDASPVDQNKGIFISTLNNKNEFGQPSPYITD